MTNTKSTHTAKQNQDSRNASKGFASMPHDKVADIARKGGQASAEKAGHEGMSERGHKGGEARASQLGHEGYVELGHKGGSAPHETRGRSRSEGESETSGSGNGRGFASQSKEKVHEAARKGGEYSHQSRVSSPEKE